MRPDGSPVHLIIMGVSGSGKTTVAEKMRGQTDFPYAEADDFHPLANKEKMAQGIALTDEDRWPWLQTIQDWMTTQARAGRSTIVTCSALRRKYRDFLADAEGEVVFIHLYGNQADITERMSNRTGHFMPASLVPSQFATLEKLGSGEQGIELNMNQSPESLAQEALGVGTAIQSRMDKAGK